MSLMLMMRHHALLAAAAKKGGGSGEIVYLTNFENYNPTTGIDTPIIGSPKYWGSCAGFFSADDTSKIIGRTRYGVFIDTFTLDGERDFLTDFSESDVYTIDFVVKTFYLLGRAQGIQGVKMYDVVTNPGQTKSASLFLKTQTDGYSDPTLYQLSVTSPKAYNLVYSKENSKQTPENIDTYPLYNGTNLANYSWFVGISDGAWTDGDVHIAVVLDNANKQYRTYANGVLINIVNSNVLENIRISINPLEKCGLCVTNFAVRKGDCSIGSGTSSTFPVPSASYRSVSDWVNPRTNLEFLTYFKNFDAGTKTDTPEIGLPYTLTSTSASGVSKCTDKLFHNYKGDGLQATGTDVNSGILFNFDDGETRTIECNLAVDSNGYDIYLVRKSDSAMFPLACYFYYDYKTSLFFSDNCTLYNGSVSKTRTITGRLINNDTTIYRTAYDINNISFLSAVLNPTEGKATLYINGIRAMSCDCNKWGGDWELKLYARNTINISSVAIYKGDRSCEDKNLYRISPLAH